MSVDLTGYTKITDLREGYTKSDRELEENAKAAWIKSLEDKGGGAVKADTDKVRIDLFPGDALLAISDILTSGAKKYEDRNWEKGMKWSRPFGALMRHMWAWWQGEKFDTETGKSHLWHAGCCIVFLIAYEIRGVGLDDRPT